MSRLGNILNALVGRTAVTTRTLVTDKCVATKQGSVVSVMINGVNSTSTTQRTTVGTLPSGWRPAIIAINGNISGNVGYGCVETDGRVQVYRPDRANERVDTLLTYIATQ